MKKKSEISKKERTAAVKDTSWEPRIKFKYEKDEKTGKSVATGFALSDGTEPSKEAAAKFREAFKRTAGTENPNHATKILYGVSCGLHHDSQEERLNYAAAMLPTLKPQDEAEAVLLGHFLALTEAGGCCLRRFHAEESFYHIERFGLLATKLFNTASQTMQALLKYRSKGQQTVQVVHLYNEGGKAIVTQNLSSSSVGEGDQGKNEE